MTTEVGIEDTPNPEVLNPAEEKDKFLSKEKLESLKKAREARSKKARELNDKQLNVVNALENIYNTLSTLDTRINTLDSHVRNTTLVQLTKRPLEQPETENPENKRLKVEPQEQHEDESMETDDYDWQGTLVDGAILFAAFTAFRFVYNYYKLTKDGDEVDESDQDSYTPAFR